jgi:hypothetical protein
MPACSLSFRAAGAAAALLIALSGCSAQNSLLSSAAGAPPPTAAGIVAEYKTFQTQWNNFFTSGNKDDPAAISNAALSYVTHGYDLAERSCLEYFTTLRSLRNQTTFYSNTLAALFAAGGVIAGLSGVAAPILVGLFAAGGLVPSSVQSFNKIYLLAEVGDDLYPAIVQGMAEFRALNPADGTVARDTAGNVISPTIDRWNADTLVRQHATLCSLPVMSTAITQSVTNLKLNVEDNGTVSVMKK